MDIMDDKTDEQLIEEFQNGEISSYNQLIYRYKDRLFNYIYQFVHDIDLAEDLLQDTFLKLYTHKNSYKEVAKFSTWLYTIAANLARTELRKIKRRKTFSVSELSNDDREYIISSDASDQSEDYLTENFEKKIQNALVQLPDDFKTIIILRDIQELSYDEISNITKLALGTVKSRINRARLKLRDIIKENRG